ALADSVLLEHVHVLALDLVLGEGVVVSRVALPCRGLPVIAEIDVVDDRLVERGAAEVLQCELARPRLCRAWLGSGPDRLGRMAAPAPGAAALPQGHPVAGHALSGSRRCRSRRGAAEGVRLGRDDLGKAGLLGPGSLCRRLRLGARYAGGLWPE